MGDSLPAWAIWAIVVPLVLVSPVIAFFLAIATEIVVGSVLDAGASGLALLGAGVAGLTLVRRLRRVRGRPALEA
jgi:ABC-type transport system involved in cytochrome c biogenesis permease component